METEETKQNSLDPKEENDFSGYDDHNDTATTEIYTDTGSLKYASSFVN